GGMTPARAQGASATEGREAEAGEEPSDARPLARLRAPGACAPNSRGPRASPSGAARGGIRDGASEAPPRLIRLEEEGGPYGPKDRTHGHGARRRLRRRARRR